jgi:hypothetical protein
MNDKDPKKKKSDVDSESDLEEEKVERCGQL